MEVVTPSDKVKGGLYETISNYLLLKNRFYDKLKEKPEVLIIGEEHINPYHAEIESKIIEYLKPKYVLFEQPADSYNEKFIRKLEDYLRKGRTLKDFSKNAGIPLDIILDVFEKTKPHIKEIEKQVREKFRDKILYMEKVNIIPTTPEELLETPFYRIPSEFWDLYYKIAEKEMWKLYNKLSEGGTKNLPTDWRNTPLKYYLLLQEIVSNYHSWNLSLERENILLRGAPTYNLIVMDSAIKSGAKIGYFDADDETRYKSVFDEEVNKERERIMGLNVIKYLKENGGPIVVITGKGHTRKGSELLKVLEEHGIKTRVIRLPTLPFTYKRIDASMYGLSVILSSIEED